MCNNDDYGIFPSFLNGSYYYDVPGMFLLGPSEWTECKFVLLGIPIYVIDFEACNYIFKIICGRDMI